MDNERLLLLAVGMILLALLIVLVDRRRTKKTMDTIEQMLDAALEGSYAESHFDESRLSALETKFSDYLSSCTLSAQNVTVEKDKIKQMISDISHQTKTPIANLTLSPHPQPLQPLLDEIAAQYTRKAGEKGLTLTVLPTAAAADFDGKWTAEALGNLVDNAIKYTPPLSIISIKAKRFGDRAVISVSDNGPGIPDDQKEELFRMFYTVNHSVADGRRGMGLGLTLCQAIVGAHGSKIKVYDNVPQGTIFRFELKVEDVKL